jgi:hypothetical protein
MHFTTNLIQPIKKWRRSIYIFSTKRIVPIPLFSSLGINPLECTLDYYFRNLDNLIPFNEMHIYFLIFLLPNHKLCALFMFFCIFILSNKKQIGSKYDDILSLSSSACIHEMYGYWMWARICITTYKNRGKAYV